MSLTIFRPIPGDETIKIERMDESITFFGNDVKSITIDDVEYGCSLNLEEFESLEEINIKKAGAVISFNRFPTKTIRISGAFDEVRVIDEQDFYCLYKHIIHEGQGLQRQLPLNAIWGAVISRESDVK